MNKEITLEQLASYETAFDSDRANRIAMDAATKNGVNNAAMRFENAREMRHTFNISLEQGDITNQKQSGRCWMFAALNTMRFRITKPFLGAFLDFQIFLLGFFRRHCFIAESFHCDPDSAAHLR